jgi:WD40 repeat protein
VPARRVTGSLSVTRTDPEDPGEPRTAVNGIVFHPDQGSLVISRVPEQEALEFWDLHRKSMTREIRGVGGEDLEVEPGRHAIATNHGQFIDLRSGRVTRRALTPGMTTTLAYSPDGRYLAAGDDSGQVTIWDNNARRTLGVLPPPPARDQEPKYVTALAFSPDGRTLAAAGKDGTLRLWDTESSRPLGSSLPTAGGTVLSLAFSPNSTVLYTTSEHVPLQTYALTPLQAAAAVCRRAGALSPADWKSHLPHLAYRKVC